MLMFTFVPIKHGAPTHRMLYITNLWTNYTNLFKKREKIYIF